MYEKALRDPNLFRFVQKSLMMLYIGFPLLWTPKISRVELRCVDLRHSGTREIYSTALSGLTINLANDILRADLLSLHSARLYASLRLNLRLLRPTKLSIAIFDKLLCHYL